MAKAPITDLESSLQALAQDARQAARLVARATAESRSEAILRMAKELETARATIEEANAQDLSAARERGLSPAMCDRLILSGERIDSLAAALREIAAAPDPVGNTTRHWTQANGLEISKMRIPLGVILMIYESRPNVTLDAAALCIRSGNVALLRGGSEAAHTNRALNKVIQAALSDTELPQSTVQLIPTQDRSAVDLLLTLDQDIDLVIPRGGEQLIRHVVQHSRIPVIQHYKGVCHVFVDADADATKALAIAENAKVQRPGVCNAMETLLVDESIADTFIPQVVSRLSPQGVEIRGCELSRSLAPSLKAADTQDWDTEYLELIMALRVVKGLPGAVAHIDQHGSNHTASIVTENNETAERFVREIDASCVLVNASTRFNDGGELGLGAEMGSSTTRIHAYGPMGAEALTAEKFVVRGSGQVRA